MGAAGRDFHVFNTCYRERSDVEVVAFTAAQIPNIDERRYPAVLAGPHYPDGVAIQPESELEALIQTHKVDEVVFAYSDVSHAHVTAQQQRVEATGARFSTFEVDATMLPSCKPIIAVTAVRTGCGKSQTARRVAAILSGAGYRTIAVRHPMPYGNLRKQGVQRFESIADLKKHDCTIEEMEEYEPHINNGVIIYSGADYAAILAEAEKEADVIIWDGGNNDTPFYKPDLWITVADPHRAGHELDFFPGDVNFQRANVILINKVDTASPEGIATVEANAREQNPGALVVHGRSPVTAANSESIRDKRVLAVEDGPTLTHGQMKFGAGVVAAKQYGAAAIIDPRPWIQGEIKTTFDIYPDIGAVLPAMGYSSEQITDLEATINAVDCDLVLIATPIDLSRLITIDKPALRVTYDLEEQGEAFSQAVLGVMRTSDG
jgi:predicted GTPase